MDICHTNNLGELIPSLVGWTTLIGAIFGAAGWLVRIVRKSHDDLSQRIDNTNQRIDSTNRCLEECIKENRMMWIETNHRMDETNKRVDHTYQLILEELRKR